MNDDARLNAQLRGMKVDGEVMAVAERVLRNDRGRNPVMVAQVRLSACLEVTAGDAKGGGYERFPAGKRGGVGNQRRETLPPIGRRGIIEEGCQPYLLCFG